MSNVHQVNTTLSLAMNAGTMMTNLQAELPGYGTVCFDPQAMTNVLSFGNIAKQYPIQYLQELDTFQVQLHDCVNIFGCHQVDKLYVLEGHQPQEDCQFASLSQEHISPISVTSHVQTIEEKCQVSHSQGDSPSQCDYAIVTLTGLSFSGRPQDYH